jgi:hypothetical protein
MYEAALNIGGFMAEMTEEEADALDELWTKTTPNIKVGAGGGFFSEHRAILPELVASTLRKELVHT